MTTKEKVIIGAVGLVITGVMAYTIYDYNDAIKTNNELIDYITRSSLCALVLEGNDAVEKVREINGSTKPEKQKEGTIRKAYAKSITENSVHSSDSVEHAKEEIELWFPGL